MSPLIAVDAFCGCGGTSLGLSRAGFAIGAAIEVESWAAETYILNHPKTAVFYDICATPASLLLDYLGIRKGDLDLLTGCPPCQGFSSIRTLNAGPARDRRNNLIFDFLHLIEEIRPKAVLFENVPGLMENWRFSHMVARLRQWRYSVTFAKLDAARFGVPQRRKRLVMAASLLGPIDLSVPKVRLRTVEDAIKGLPIPRISGNWLHRWHSKHSKEVLERIRSIPKNGGSRAHLGKKQQLLCHRKKDGFHDVYGRMEWSRVAPTITRFSNNPSKGRFLHPTQNRALTLLESAILQSFPRSYRFPHNAPPTVIASMIGEAFPPKMAEMLAKRVTEQLTEAG